MPVSEFYFADIEAEIVLFYIPLLLGLDVMTKFKVIPDYDKDFVRFKCDGWSVPMVRKLHHAYIVWAPSIVYTDYELHLVYSHFYRPRADRLYALKKSAKPEIASRKLLKGLEHI